MVVGQNIIGTEVAVIGAGPGGYAAAIRLAQLGKDVTLIEREQTLGGICLTEGCIPSKALIHAADLAVSMREASTMGIDATQVTVDMQRLIAWKDRVINRLTGGVSSLVNKNGVRVLRGRASFASPKMLKVETAKNPELIEFQQAIIATGSLPAPLPGFVTDGEKVIGSREALSLTEVPERLVVIGGGYIGLELAQVYAKLGSEVSIVEYQNELLPQLDSDVRQVLMRRLKELGLQLYLSSAAEELLPTGGVRVKNVARETSSDIPADKVLVAVGRVPQSASLGLELAHVSCDARGFIEVDDKMRTSTPGIFALGDVTGSPQLAHKAYREAKVAAEAIAGQPTAFDNITIPAVIYTDPEIAWTGYSATEAQNSGYEITTGKFPFSASGRALSLNAPRGFVKTVADRSSGLILGVTIVGQDAGDLIAEAALALEMGSFLDDVAGTIHPHPTLSEALAESAEAALGQSIHILNH